MKQTNKFLEANPESGKLFYQNFHRKGKIVMLNLLKFLPIADYANLDSLKPKEQITGREAYQLYMEKTLPLLHKAGSEILYYGDCNNYLIGPESENWDAVLLVEHQSVTKFMEFAQDAYYLKYAGHRTAALGDSRLLPITKNEKYS